MSNNYLFSSESVSIGHPDKIADQIADTILDGILIQDPTARVACEVTVSTGLVLVVGEISTSAFVDIQSLVRSKIKEIGYKDKKFGFDGDTCAILTAIDEQSGDIAQGVDDPFDSKGGSDDLSIGAGDQGVMFGFASNETESYMPLGVVLAQNLMKKAKEVREKGEIPYLGPDAKSQVTIEYDEFDRPQRVDAIVLSTQHLAEIGLDQVKKDVLEYIVKPVIPANLIDEKTKFYINPTGRFVLGGPQADTGQTGRKIMVDSYGAYARSGGGAFSGKDATKVDRSAAYMARYVAKNLVAAGVAPKIQLQVSYAIGLEKPLSLNVDTFGQSKYSNEEIVDVINKVFDFRPGAIIKTLDLRRPIYAPLAAFGHFGRDDLDLTWEKLDKVSEIKKNLYNS
ncbi:methionine adenosyltransferase [Xylocopilactobacillus apicola]|uniref:S-adenosylmethionine synthase n=1 Tax=Xylocopilactobacillus apicola TaxID=2932184 RepID=A0AAU9DT47_9LACO|nr:methionine adenosyltransferase [Xylocopilactobacillus apicola]BDR58523.1 S-adenosylmethionine synthase [Xylocopilactobacillus apicola]